MSYEVSISERVKRELRSLSGAIFKWMTNKMLALGKHPRPAGCLKLKGGDGRTWRLRVGDYRILYEIEDVLLIVDILPAGHRSDVYDR